ncbi:nucleotidyltransferase family protein [Veillonella sp. KGMB01456]|uniref:nucleotidyltransferase family protein n=1 Tax=Veillonella sp. KGMB01456 TaxID=2934794 RepID=UPI001FF59971|nr:nucleotidyltransferase family protein [Veillonella sp. KGMB01456]MCK0528744.1 nucleotidyltransferase family protein [Veillonella sp. KGMB01456]
MEIDVVILAAGLSRRMGTSKVLLPWRGGTLLEAACQVYGDLGGKRIVVIGGERAEEAARIVNACGFTAVYNEKPEAGQSRSLALGIAALADSARPVLCAVADQPLMTKEAAGQMQVAYSKLEQNDKPILCPLYGPNKERGNPVIFSPDWKDALQQLVGDEGGRRLIRGAAKEYVQFIEISEPIGVDVDTPFEYEQLYNRRGKI